MEGGKNLSKHGQYMWVTGIKSCTCGGLSFGYEFYIFAAIFLALALGNIKSVALCFSY